MNILRQTKIFAVVATLALTSFGSSSAFAQSKKKKKAAPAEMSESATEEAPRKRGSSAGSGSWSRPYGLAGCGWGSQLMGKKGGQISASTTNSTSGTQTFGITSGTSNCTDDENNEVANRMDLFVVGNKVALADDIARGQGETLNGISQLMGCQDQSKLNAALQSEFATIFPNAEVVANEVTDSIVTVVMNDSALLSSCAKVSAKLASN